MPNSDSSKPFEKKTERLDVRLSHEKKQAFSEACENQGDTPSSAVRRFINSYIRRSNRDDITAIIRGKTKGKGLMVAGGVVALITSAVLIPKLTSTAPEGMSKAELFAYYDYDNSGLIEPGEISHNDDHLHRVLNIDGKPGISDKEFYTHGTMVWYLSTPENTTIVKEYKRTSDGRSTRQVSVSTFSIDDFPEGTLIPTGDPEKPFLTVEEFKALDKPIWEVQNFDVSPELTRDALKKSNLLGEIPQLLKRNFVIFDLREPKSFQIDVLEQTSHTMMSKSMAYQRSVEWVDGDAIPHFVMGEGHNWWKSLKE